jgi:hypothetical protein
LPLADLCQRVGRVVRLHTRGHREIDLQIMDLTLLSTCLLGKYFPLRHFRSGPSVSALAWSVGAPTDAQDAEVAA